MSHKLCLALFAGVSLIAVAQQPAFPADIDPKSMSRFPIVERAEMKTDADRAAYDYVVGTVPRQVPLRGPGGVSLHSPGTAEPIERLNRYLRSESVIGRRLFELCAIIGAWEIEQQYDGPGMRLRRCSSASARRPSTRLSSTARLRDYPKTRWW